MLDATLDLLEKHGYEALRIDEVARRARVNKTSVYRRWPTKAELVVAALLSAREEDDAPAPTGVLRADLIAHLENKARRLRTPRGRVLAVTLTALEAPALAAVTNELRRRRFVTPIDLLEGAIARGEVRADTDARVVNDLLSAPIYYRAIVMREPLERAAIEALVDQVLRSIAVPAKRARR